MANDNDIIARLKVEGLNQFKAELAQSSKSADGTTTAVQRMEKAIADATDPKDVQRLTKELEAVKVATEASQTAFESSKAKLRAYKEEATGLATILATMKSEGKQNTQTFKDIEKQFEATKKKAGELSDQINDINQEIKSLGSDTRGIDNVVRGATLMANSFQLATGVQALFGKENKALTEGLLKLNGIMAVTQSIQQIGNELTREDSIITQAVTKAKQLYAIAMEGATNATKIFYGFATGGFILVLGLIASNWEEIAKFLGFAGDKAKELTKVYEELKKQEQDRKELQDAELRYLKAKGLSQDEIIKKEIAIAEAELATIEQRIKYASARFVNPNDPNAFEMRKKAQQEAIEIEKQYEVQLLNSKARILELRKSLEDNNKTKKDEVVTNKSVKDSIEALDSIGLTYGINSEKYIKEQIDRFTLLRSTLDITSQEYKDLGELIDLLNKKLAGKQKIEPIDLSGALKGIGPKVIEKRPLTLYERIFGSREENVDAQKRIENQVKGSLKIVSEINKYGQQISSIAEQAIQIRSANELQLLEDKKNRGLITEKEYEKQSAQIKNEAAQKKRKIDIANATAQIPVAVLSAYIAGLQIGGPAAPIVAGILAGVAGAFGLAQVALIASAPLPKFRDGGSVRKRLGLIKGKKHEQGGVPIEVEGDEFVMKSQATKKYGVKMLEDINNLRYNPIITANGKLSNKNKQDTRIYENLAIIGSYLKQGYKVDAQGNQILKEISDKLNNKSVYV